MTNHHPRVMEGNWNSTEVWPVPVECLLNGMNTPESHLMFGSNHMLPPHFRHRFQTPVCLSTAHLGPPSGSLNQINVSIPTHSMVDGSQVAVDNSAGSAERNDPDAHSISQPMALDSSDVLDETDEASDEDEEDEEDGDEEVAVPMSLVHDQQQQHSQAVTMSHPIDNDTLVQCQQDPLQVNSLQGVGDPMQQQGPLMSSMSQEQCQHQKSALVNNAMTHAHAHSAANSSMDQQLPHPHAHPLSGNQMISNPLSLPLLQQQPPNAFSSNSIPNDNSSQGSADPNLGYTVQGKMYYEGRVVLHLKQLRNSFGGMNGGFHSNGFSSCAEADLSKNNNLMGCAICRLRNSDAQNSQRQKEAHRHSVKGVLFTFEDCLIVELYPDHIPINSNPNDLKPPSAAPEPQKPNHPMPISTYINSQPPPHGPNHGKRMMNHGIEDHMDPLSAVIVANKHHPQGPPHHHHQQQHPQPHELHQHQPNTEESSWWDDFESEDELKRTEGSANHGGDRGIVTMKLNPEQAQHHNSSLPQIHSQTHEPTNQQPVDHSTSSTMLSHDLLEQHDCMANEVVSLSHPPQIQSVQSIVPLEIDLSAPNSVGISEDSSSHSVGLPSQQQCVELEEGECEEQEPQMVVVEVVVSNKDVVQEVASGGDYNSKTSSATVISTKYPCPACTRSFHLKKMLKTHLEEMHHSGNPYRCVQCEAQFADERRLRKHSCTLSVQKLKSRERVLSFTSVFDHNSETEKKSMPHVSTVGSGHSDTQDDTESEEDFFEDSVTVSDIEDDNASNQTPDNSSSEEDGEDEEDDDEDEFPDLQIVTSAKRKNQNLTTARNEKKSKNEKMKVEYLNCRGRLKPQVFHDEDDDEEDDYEDENENSQDENDYECAVESQCMEENSEKSPDAKKLHTRTPASNHSREKKKAIHVGGRTAPTSFKKNSCLNGKKKLKKGGKPFNCGICGKGFSIERRLENHKASHATERFSQCEKCGKRFARKDKLMRHMYVHSEEKMFVCDICQKRFSRRDKLSDHLKSHGTDEIHNCPMCQKQFLRPDILKQHVKLHGMGNKHQCPECLRFVTGKDRLEKHMARHEEAKALGQTLLCPLCTKYFIQRQSLKAHIKKFHPEALKILNLDQNVSPANNSSTKSPKSSESTLSNPSALQSSSSDARGRTNLRTGTVLTEMIDSKTVSNKPFACQYCPRIFVRKIGLKKHLRKHPQNHLKISDEPTESEQCTEEEGEDKMSLPRSSEVDPDSGLSMGRTSHNIQSIISAPPTASTTNAQSSGVGASVLASSSSSNSSSTPPMSLSQISAPSPGPAIPSPPTPTMHHQLPLSSSSISCSGGSNIIAVSPVTHIPLPQSLANVSNAQAILERAASEMSHFAVATHHHHAHQHLASPHYSSSAHNFLTAATICSVSVQPSSLHQQTTITTSAGSQQPADAVPDQLPSSPLSQSQVGQLHPHLSQQLTVPLQHHVNVSMAPSQSICGSSYLLAAYPHYSYQ